jgi:transposase
MTEQRYRAVLEVQAGVPVTEVAERFRVSRQAMYRWLGCCRKEGPEGLVDPVAPRLPTAPTGGRHRSESRRDGCQKICHGLAQRKAGEDFDVEKLPLRIHLQEHMAAGVVYLHVDRADTQAEFVHE